MEQPVRKLNKKHIYLCMLGLFALSIPAIVSIASTEKKSVAKQAEREPQANLNMHDTKAIAGTEHFPETYNDMKKFEKELALANPKEEQVIDLLARLEEQKPAPPTHRGYGSREDNTYREASNREREQRASDHFEARRSDIMFINNTKNNQNSREEFDRDPEMEKFLHQALAMAPPTSPQDMLLIKPNEAKENNFLDGKTSPGVIKNPSHFMVSQGTLIDAILLSEINTDLPGPIIARVSHNIWDSKTGQFLLIPQNSKLIGEYNSVVGNGQTRTQIVWNRIIYPNQQSFDLGRMVGVDKKGTSGSPGSVNNHYDKVALALLMTTTIGAGMRMTQGKYDANTASMGQEVGNAFAEEATSLGNKIADKMLGVKPTITVPMGERMNVFVEQDLHLEPYSG